MSFNIITNEPTSINTLNSSNKNGSAISLFNTRKPIRPMLSYREDYELPSARNDYIRSHPSTLMAALHSDERQLAPVWSKISVTPHDGRKVIIGGYGRKMQKTSISIDAPEQFVNPDRVKMPANRLDKVTASITRIPKPHVLDSTWVLPGGRSIHSTTTQKMNTGKHEGMCFGKQTLLKVLVDSARGDSTPVSWAGDPLDTGRSSRSGTARSSQMTQ